jgi:16S rRNA (guanine(966)-N(2))-methyltransferase RsmD
MRIITGKYKGRRFDVPRTFKARPTTDFAKENLFNVLTGYIDFEDATALDLFSGTGSITLELLSRGCRQVISVENDMQHRRFIAKTLEELGDEGGISIKGDVFKFVERCHEEFDFIFADPPYALKELGTLPTVILNQGILKPEGIFVLEHGKDYDFSNHPLCFDQRVYGSVHFSFFKK